MTIARVWYALSCALCLVAICHAASDPSTTRGVIIPEGGGSSNKVALQHFADAVQGQKEVCFITTASPTNSSGGKWLEPFGLKPKPILVSAENAESQDIATQLKACDGYYFDGGAPKLLSDAFFKDGHETLALATIRNGNRHGKAIGGASAGAMILGPGTTCACGMHIGVLALDGQPIPVSKGFAFLPVALDAHAFVQNLYTRELPVMAQENWQRMLVLDEGAAVEIPGDGSPWRVLGERTVALLVAPKNPKSLIDFDISFLRSDDQIDPARFEAITTGRKALPPPPPANAAEDLQAPSNALLWMANQIAYGAATTTLWDGFWYPDHPLRIKLAWTNKSTAFEGLKSSDKRMALLNHLSLSLQRRTREDYKLAVTVPFERRIADRDWGISPIDGPRKDCVYDGPTPTTAPGVTVVDKEQFKASLKDGKTLVINALPPMPGEHSVVNIPGSVWLSGGGRCGSIGDDIDAKLSIRLKALTKGDTATPLVFYCAHAACWWSYNAAERAKHLSYANVRWYRGGLSDWLNYGEPTERTDKDQW